MQWGCLEAVECKPESESLCDAYAAWSAKGFVACRAIPPPEAAVEQQRAHARESCCWEIGHDAAMYDVFACQVDSAFSKCQEHRRAQVSCIEDADGDSSGSQSGETSSGEDEVGGEDGQDKSSSSSCSIGSISPLCGTGIAVLFLGATWRRRFRSSSFRRN